MTSPATVTLAALTAAAITPALFALARRLCERPSPRSLLRSRMVIAATALLSAAAAAAAAWRWDTTTAVTALPLLALALPAVLVDLQEMRLPRALTLTFTTTAVLVSWLPAALRGDYHAPVRVLVAAAVAAVALLAVGLINHTVIGLGDIRLAPGLVAYLVVPGVQTLILGVWLWLVLIAVTAAISRVTRRDADDDTIPHGPALLLGTVTALLLA